MKLSRRLIPAFAMLLVSAVLMSTASFAWFSINDEVTATGMSVTATADSSLVIKGNGDSYYTNVGTNTYGTNNDGSAKTGPNLKPCTSADGKNFARLSDNIKVLSAASAQSAWGGDGFQSADLTAVTERDFANYVAMTTFSIQNIAENATVYVSNITVTGKTADAGLLAPAIRIGVKIGEDEVMIYKPDANAVNLTEGVGKYDPDTQMWSLEAAAYTAFGGNAKVPNGDLTADMPEDVVIYIWVEGQDQACMSDNVDATQFGITINFKTV